MIQGTAKDRQPKRTADVVDDRIPQPHGNANGVATLRRMSTVAFIMGTEECPTERAKVTCRRVRLRGGQQCI